MYIIFDNMEYRDGVHKSMGTTKTYVKDIDVGIDLLTSNIGHLSSNIDTMTSNMSMVEKNRNSIYSITSNIAEHDRLITRTQENVSNMTNSIQESKTGVEEVSNNMNNLDNNLKKYFNFSDNQEALNNDRLFEHRLSGIQPELDVISRVTAIGGMIVKTPEEISHDKNMKICNEQNNCIQLNVNSNGFNITPDNLNKMTINAKDTQPMALFDMENKSIYLGGVDNNSPLFIENGELYISKLNVKENGLWSQFSTPKIAGPHHPQPTVVPPVVAKDITATYTFVSTLKNIDNGASYVDEDAEFMQLFIINIVSQHVLKEDDLLIILIPTDHIGQFEGVSGENSIDGLNGTEMFNIIQKNEYYIRERVSDIYENFTNTLNLRKIGDEYIQLDLKISKNIGAGTKLSLEYIGINMLNRQSESNFEIMDGIPVTIEYKST